MQPGARGPGMYNQAPYGQGPVQQAPLSGMPGAFPGARPASFPPGMPQMQQQQQPMQPMSAPGGMMPAARPGFSSIQPAGGPMQMAPATTGAPFGQQGPRPMSGGAPGYGPVGQPQQVGPGPMPFPGPAAPGSVRPGMPTGPMPMQSQVAGGPRGMMQGMQQQPMQQQTMQQQAPVSMRPVMAAPGGFPPQSGLVAGPRPGMGMVQGMQGMSLGQGQGPPAGPFGTGAGARPPAGPVGPPMPGPGLGPMPQQGGGGMPVGPGGQGPRPSPFSTPFGAAQGQAPHPAGPPAPLPQSTGPFAQGQGAFPHQQQQPPMGMSGPKPGMQGPGPAGGVSNPFGAGAGAVPSSSPFGDTAQGSFGSPMSGRGPGAQGPQPANAMMGPTAPPVGQGGMSNAPGALVSMAEVDNAACCLPAYMCLTSGAIAADSGLQAKSGLPFGLCVQPLAEGDGTLRGRVPLVNFGSAGVVRCKKCRAYVNPFVKFMDAGRRWRCNFCHFVNDVPAQYFAACDEYGNRMDRHERPELSTGTVEFVAPAEYMVRAPQPPVYMFVLDVSFTAVSTGVLEATCATIRDCLDRLPGQDRVQVGFVTFDTTVHFYSLRASGQPSGGDTERANFKPQQLVVSDVDDLFLPVPEDLLVNLSDARSAVHSLLSSLPATFAATRVMDSCLGAALNGAYQVMQHIGGKMIVTQTCLPTVGPGKLKTREAPRMLGGDQEHTLLAPCPTDDGAVYKNKAIDYSKQQVSVDMFLFNHAYADVATLGALSRYTAGQVYYYPGFTRASDGVRYASDLARDLTRTTGFEAVMRIRASKGVNINNFYGNFFIRGTDLLALPNVTPETAFNVELSHEEALQPGSVMAVQAALLYTTSTGERRIFVHTLAKPVTQLVSDLFARSDVDSLTNMLMKVALDHELRLGVAAARRYLHKQLLDICRAYRAATTAPYGMAGMGMPGGGMGGGVGGGMNSRMPMPMPAAPGAVGGAAAAAGGDITTLLPEALQMLPLYIMGVQKSRMFRGGDAIRSDERAALVYRVLSMPLAHSRHFVYPRLFSLHDLDASAGRPDGAAEADPATAGQGRVTLPGVSTLSATVLSPAGAYLLDNGTEQYVWIGREAPGGLLNALFGIESMTGVDASALALVEQGNDYSSRVVGIARTLALESFCAPKLRVVREGAASGAGGGQMDGLNEQRFHWHLIEDRQAFPGGSVTYAEYVHIVVKEASMVAMGGSVPGQGQGALQY